MGPALRARLLGFGNGLIAKIKVGSPDFARDTVDLVAATIDSLAWVVENDIFGVELFNRRASASRVVSTEDS